ncbi:MAG: hypothetical protein WBD86_02845, partial [Microgenomates group bacterium]
TKVYDSPGNEIFGERYTAAQVEWIIYGLFAFVLNKTTGDPETTNCLMNNDLGDCINRLKDFFTAPQQGQGGVSTQSFAGFLLQDKPLSGITYFKQKAKDLNLIPEAKAQGFGFGTLDPILPLWKVSRNISYALFIIIILVIAFMIMCRVKISPQTVISAQSALPKIVIALILVTFSYAIAGFLVDLMYVVIGIISIFLSQVFTALESPYVPPSMTFFKFLTQGFLGTGIVGVIGLYWILFLFISIFTLVGVNGLGGMVLGALTGLNIVLSLIGILLTLILAILLIFIGLKIIWMLLKAFVMILLLVLIAPFQIALGVVASESGFGAWLRSFISNLAVFPLTGLLISLSYIFLTMAALTTLEGISFSDFFKDIGFAIPGVSLIMGAVEHQGWPPLLVFGVKNPFGILYLGVSVVILFILPKTADIIKAVIERKPFTYGTAIGEAFAPARWAWDWGPTRAVREARSIATASTIVGALSQYKGPGRGFVGKLLGGVPEELQRQADRKSV